MEREYRVGEHIGQVLREELCMIEHSEELVEVAAKKDEVEWALEAELDQVALEFVDVWKDEHF